MVEEAERKLERGRSPTEREARDWERKWDSVLTVYYLRLFLPFYPVVYALSLWTLVIPSFRRYRVHARAWKDFKFLWKAVYSRGAAQQYQTWKERAGCWYKEEEDIRND